MDFIFLVDECLELGVLWKSANPALKKTCWQTTTEQVHSFKSIMQTKNKRTFGRTSSAYSPIFLSDICNVHIFHWVQSKRIFKLVIARHCMTFHIIDPFQYEPFRMLKLESWTLHFEDKFKFRDRGVKSFSFTLS